MNYSKIDQDHIWHPFTQMKTAGEHPVVERAQGEFMHTVDGRTFIDVNSSWWVNPHGHCHPYVMEQLKQQLERLDHTIFAGFSHVDACEMVSKLIKVVPDGLNRVFFSDDGSTSVEVALKMSIQYFHNHGQDRKRIIAMDGAYHGDTFGAMSLGERGMFNKPFEPYLFDVEVVDLPDSGNAGRVLSDLKAILEKGDCCAFIFEPLVQGSAGMRMYPADVLQQMVELARSYGVLIIADEVMTGFGRTGKFFACDHIEANPDILCCSKALTAGVLPLGLTLATEKVYEAFLHDEKDKALLHGHSYTGNPMACRAAIASLDLMAQEETWKNIERCSARHAEFLSEVSTHPRVSSTRQLGTIASLELKTDGGGYFDNIRDRAYDSFIKKGLLIRPLGNVIFINAPYVISDESLDRIYRGIREFLDEI